MQITPAIERLAAYRLEADLSFGELAAQMAEKGYSVVPRSLYQVLTSRLSTKPRDRMLYKIDRFVALLDAEGHNGHKRPTTKPARSNGRARRKR